MIGESIGAYSVILLINNTKQEAAEIIVQDLRNRIDEKTFPLGCKESLKVVVVFIVWRIC